MTDIDDLFRNHVPWIGYDIPPDERKAVRAIESLLHQLESYEEDFRAALELYDLCESDPNNTPFRWPFIATRDAAMTIYHFKMTMQETRESFQYAPSLRDRVDHVAMRLANNLFDSYFPRAERLRHAIAHAAETNADAIRDGTGVVILHSRQGRRYITDYEGERLSYELSQDNLDRLHDIKMRVFACFNQVNAYLHRPEPP